MLNWQAGISFTISPLPLPALLRGDTFDGELCSLFAKSPFCGGDVVVCPIGAGVVVVVVAVTSVTAVVCKPLFGIGCVGELFGLIEVCDAAADTAAAAAACAALLSDC